MKAEEMKAEDTVTLRALNMTFGDLHTPDGIFTVKSGLVEVSATVAKSQYFRDATQFAPHVVDPAPAS